jgi:hypothetical protein
MIGFVITLLVLPLIVDKEDITPVASIIFCVSWPLVYAYWIYVYTKHKISGEDDDEMGL